MEGAERDIGWIWEELGEEWPECIIISSQIINKSIISKSVKQKTTTVEWRTVQTERRKLWA